MQKLTLEDENNKMLACKGHIRLESHFLQAERNRILLGTWVSVITGSTFI